MTRARTSQDEPPISEESPPSSRRPHKPPYPTEKQRSTAGRKRRRRSPKRTHRSAALCCPHCRLHIPVGVRTAGKMTHRTHRLHTSSQYTVESTRTAPSKRLTPSPPFQAGALTFHTRRFRRAISLRSPRGQRVIRTLVAHRRFERRARWNPLESR